MTPITEPDQIEDLDEKTWVKIHRKETGGRAAAGADCCWE